MQQRAPRNLYPQSVGTVMRMAYLVDEATFRVIASAGAAGSTIAEMDATGADPRRNRAGEEVERCQAAVFP
jgi:hypothetical protein